MNLIKRENKFTFLTPLADIFFWFYAKSHLILIYLFVENSIKVKKNFLKVKNITPLTDFFIVLNVKLLFINVRLL